MTRDEMINALPNELRLEIKSVERTIKHALRMLGSGELTTDQFAMLMAALTLTVCLRPEILDEMENK